MIDAWATYTDQAQYYDHLHLILYWSPMTHQSMESTRPLKVCGGTWHQDISSRSFKSCKFCKGPPSGNLEDKPTAQTHCYVPQTIPGLYMVCNNALIGGMCQSTIHMDDRTKGLPVEHCPKHHTSSTSLPSSHSLSWYHVFPRYAMSST